MTRLVGHDTDPECPPDDDDASVDPAFRRPKRRDSWAGSRVPTFWPLVNPSRPDHRVLTGWPLTGLGELGKLAELGELGPVGRDLGRPRRRAGD
jgi:hypothetical protein